ncbi:N-sulfoglucosamine sulfohydrolase [Catalinimonas alkaloidigena]|uniref:sulfatase family protein n=1 Tax=Catalinimonas alkaloidigena TaxID=1075417 RepID=UPI0024069755|nr:sulfatase [Catalinimonas alkaloidigena]MDF9798988.1 N-sulfoglucosamine sulfohydrolase [Catalinimonas alkaloidigena]
MNLKPSLLLAGCLLLLLFQNSNAQNNPPNVVFIIADDIGWNDLGCYGNTEVQTPNIDRMAQEGIRFTNTYLTASSCSPSRTSIISGRYPHNTGSAELHTPLPAEVAIFPELMQNAGYYTAQAGKWHMGEHARRGFDVIHDNGKENGDGGEEMWVSSLKERPKDKPFFMWFAAFDAHRPWGTNEFSGTHEAGDITPPPYLADAESTQEDLAKYYDEVTRFDDYIGKVEQELEAQGVLDNTLIIIMSDNGRPFPRSKTRVYDSGMKTPFVVKWNAGLPRKGVVSNSLISVIDIAPTLLELSGAEIQPGFQGKSFAGVLENPASKFRNYVFSEHNWHDQEALERMVRTEGYLYVLNLRPNLSNPGPADSNKSPSFQDLKDLRDAGELSAAQADMFMAPRPAEELFNCYTDPMQLVNVASLPEYQSRLKYMREVLQQWRTETLDTTPTQLTPDWYDRETGDPLDIERTRGEMPGGKEAVQTNAKGPF